MARIVIVGSGVVGTATGKGFSQIGHDVSFVDVLPDRLRQLREEGFDASTDIVLGDDPAFIFLTLPTPNVGYRYDLAAFKNGVAAVGRAIGRSSAVHTVIVRSTVPPGTTEGVVRPLLEAESGKSVDESFLLASNPEFLRAASAELDFKRPWMTVIASRNSRACERLRDLLAPFGGETRIFDNPASAELIKCSHNIYNATKISFWNEMWLVAAKLDIDPSDISATVALSAEGSFNQNYGIRGGAPYGGACLPKDTNGFLGFAADRGLEMPMLRAVVTVNEQFQAIEDQEIEALLDEPGTAARSV
jgi:UDPglucose 6-dehydrogenase